MATKKQNKDALIQTRVPKKLADYALKAAERDGISVAAWLRRLVMADMERPRAHPLVREARITGES